MKNLFYTILLMASFQVQAGVIISAADSNIGNSNNGDFFDNVFGDQNVIGLYSSIDPWALNNWDNVATATSLSYSQSTTLTSNDLIGADWLIAASGALYTAGTIQVINDFMIAGGNIWVGGEAAVYNAFGSANQLLSALGSTMSLNSLSTSSFDVAANTNLDAYTAGTDDFYGNYQSTVAGGVALYANNGNSVLSIDRTTFSVTPVPEPTSLALIALGLAGFGFAKKRKSA